jgi:hypothetical protein
MEQQNKKIKLDLWGNTLDVEPPETVNEEHLKKLREEIISDGINKRSYSSVENSEIDSDDELVMKFVKPKNKNKSNEFDSVSYSFVLSNKLSKIRSELARSEERLHYLKLDHNNLTLISQEQTKLIRQYRLEIKQLNETVKNNSYTITKIQKNTKIFKIFITITILVNAFTCASFYF